jgi:hypothetical protein
MGMNDDRGQCVRSEPAEEESLPLERKRRVFKNPLQDGKGFWSNNLRVFLRKALEMVNGEISLAKIRRLVLNLLFREGFLPL